MLYNLLEKNVLGQINRFEGRFEDLGLRPEDRKIDDSKEYGRIFDSLKGRSIRVITYDHQGMGRIVASDIAGKVVGVDADSEGLKVNFEGREMVTLPAFDKVVRSINWKDGNNQNRVLTFGTCKAEEMANVKGAVVFDVMMG